jgi:hypothetical protein
MNQQGTKSLTLKPKSPVVDRAIFVFKEITGYSFKNAIKASLLIL